jgi:hypothetical protein
VHGIGEADEHDRDRVAHVDEVDVLFLLLDLHVGVLCRDRDFRRLGGHTGDADCGGDQKAFHRVLPV